MLKVWGRRSPFNVQHIMIPFGEPRGRPLDS